MADNSAIDPGTSPTTTVATDVVTYSGDPNVNVQLVRPVLTTGAEGSKTVVDLPGDATNGLDVDVTRVSGTVTISGAVTVSSGAITATETKPTTGTQSSVSGSASSVTLLASNASRKGAMIANDSSAALYVLLGSGAASTTAYTVKLNQDDVFELPYPVYTGQITGIWASATGAARVTETT
jgi:hypothetical protein